MSLVRVHYLPYDMLYGGTSITNSGAITINSGAMTNPAYWQSFVNLSYVPPAEKPSITNELIEAFVAWIKQPHKDETDKLQTELAGLRQKWCYKMLNLMDEYDTKKVHAELIELFPFLKALPVSFGCRKRFLVRFAKFIVFKFITNETDGTTKMTYEYTTSKHAERKIVRGPITTEIYVVQTPIKYTESEDILKELKIDGDTKEWCKKNDVKPEQINHSVKLPYMIITTTDDNGVTTYIRQLINKDDEFYKKEANEHIMLCNYQFRESDIQTVNYDGDITAVATYDNLYQTFENGRVKMPEVKLPEVKLPEVKLYNVKTPEVKLPEQKVELTEATLIKTAEQRKSGYVMACELLKQTPDTQIYDEELIRLKSVLQEPDRQTQIEKLKVDDLKRRRDELTKQLEKLAKE